MKSSLNNITCAYQGVVVGMHRLDSEAQMRVFAFAVQVMLLLTSTVLAQSSEMRLGNWEVISKVQMSGMPVQMPTQTNKQTICVTSTDKPPIADDRTCKITNYRKAGAILTWSMECTGQAPMVGEGKITVSGEQYTGNVDMLMKPPGAAPITVKVEYSGKWLGRC